MPQMIINVTTNEVADIIQAMDKREIETLLLLLSEEGAELLERKQDFDLDRVRFLTRDEVFDV